jgi:hypothetical protein
MTHREMAVDHLAKEIARDNILGTSTIDMDWGNCSIKCEDDYMKSLLIELAREYLKLKNEKTAILQTVFIS